MRNMDNTQKTITSALEELGAELGISEADFDVKVNVRNAVCNLAAPQIELSELKLGTALQRRPQWSLETGLVRVHTGESRKARGEMSFPGASTH